MTDLDHAFLTRLRRATEEAWREGSGGWVPGTRWTGGIDVDALERPMRISDTGEIAGIPFWGELVEHTAGGPVG